MKTVYAANKTRPIGVTLPPLGTVRRIKTATGAMMREPPRELQIWDVGANATDFGVHVWSARSIDEVFARYNARGNPLLIDVEHNGAQLEDGEPTVTAGYARLEVRSGAPWLVFEWSDYGREQIATGQRRFLSPEYDVDKVSGEILALYRVALVAEPGTHRARMLASSPRSVEKRMELPMILAALRAALAAEDPAVAKESISNLVAELEKSAGGEKTDDADVTDPPTEAGADDDEKPAPMAAAADDEDDKEKDKTKAKASAKPAPKAAPAKSGTDAVQAAARDGVLVIHNATRDHLMATQGDKLDPAIRRWAKSQPLEVVSGLLDAAPAKDVSAARVSATRGAGGVGGLTARELQKCKAKGIDPAKYAELKAASVGGS